MLCGYGERQRIGSRGDAATVAAGVIDAVCITTLSPDVVAELAQMNSQNNGMMCSKQFA